MSVTAYILLEAGTAAELQALVTTKIGEGYQPFGFPYVHALNGSPEQTRILQAMITGSQVLVGAPGADGTNGTSGTVVTFGTAAASGGANGDVYVKTDTGGIYKKVAGSWVLQVTLTVAA